MEHQALPHAGRLDDSLGLMSNTVRMAPYSVSWPVHYLVERNRLAEALAFAKPVLAHIGSTAVLGLKAKPIIDILMGIKMPADRVGVVRALEALGYVAHGEKGVPGRLFFSLGNPVRFHLHLVEFGGEIWDGHILFRDSLIADRELAESYEGLKLVLAQQYPFDRDSYTRGKAAFIEQALAKLKGNCCIN